MRKTLLIALVVVLAAVAAGAWYWFAGRGQAVQYRFGKVERGSLTAAVSATGTLNPVVSVLVGSQVSGQVKEIYADYNSPVKKDQIIARIDPDSFSLRVNQSMADLEAARATVLTQRANVVALQAEVSRAKVNLADAERDLKRNEMLIEKGFVSTAVRDKSQAVFDAAREQVKTAEAQLAVGGAQVRNAEALVQQRQAQLDQAKVDLARTAIRSPVDGIVIARSIDAGQTVAASLQAPTLFTIAQDLRAMQVDTSIDEAEIGRIRVDQEATFTVDSFPGRTFRGKVTQVRKAPQVIQNVVTYIAVISADNPDLALVPGMTANVRVIVDQREGVLKVPNAALRFRPAGADAPKDEAAKAEGAAKGGAEAQQALRERLVKELKLDAEQQSRLDAIFADQRQKMQALREGAEADRRKQFERVRAESRAKIAEMLNPEQKALYQEIIASQGGRSAARGRVWTLADGKPKGVAVRLGISDGTFTELVAGELQEGAEVIVGVADAGKDTARTAPGGPRFGF